MTPVPDHDDRLSEDVEKGARALTLAGLNALRPVGDVLHDYDWTPMEAARAVLSAANHAELVEENERLRTALMGVQCDMAELAARSAQSSVKEHAFAVREAVRAALAPPPDNGGQDA